MARKYSKGKKPEETMRQRQRRLLQEQRARKASQPTTKAKPSTTVKSTPDSNPAKRGAQGPRNPSKQGPYRKPVSAMQGDTGRTGSTSRTAPPTQKYRPRVSNVGPQIRQADKVRSIQSDRAARLAAKAGKIPANETPGQRIRRTGGTYRGMKYPGGGKPGVRIGTSARTRVRGGRGGVGSGVKTTLAAGLATAASVGSLRSPISNAKRDAQRKNGQKATLNGKPVVWRNGKWVPAPSQSAGKYNTKDADGTVRSRKKVGPAKVGTKKVGTIAQAFDKSYAAAKKAGKKTFMFRGKKYTTN
tara:strand:- start:116 stop:1018 length:903 start_codon:yes stop_codon:yes gene_type:complete